jgi:glycosyltransferase involved in cell wall biosynthesis
MFRASFFASPLARLTRVPVILDTSHGRELWRTGWKKSFVVDRLIARTIDCTIAVSDSTARYLIQEKHFPSAKVKVVRNGVNLDRYRPETADKTAIRQSLNIDENVPLLIVLGRLDPQKGHRFLIEAMSTVRKEFPNVQVVCLGEGALRKELEHLTKSKGLEDTIRFPGYESDVLPWLRAADLSVLPSLFEGLPMVAMETLAAGCPMVATAVDGTPEVILNAETGLLVPPRDPGSLASAILQMLRDPDRARRMAEAGRRLVFEQFSVERMVRHTEELYLQTWDEYLDRRCRQKQFVRA